jgi:hypothetical protein
MKTSSPINSDVAFATVQAGSSFHATTSADTTELEQSIEDRTIVSDVVFALLFGILLHVVWSDLGKEVDVFVSVELCHFMLSSRFRSL